MKAIVTVVGKDTVGIIAKVCTILADHKVNVLDISQTVLHDYFTMIMVTDVTDANTDFAELADKLHAFGLTQELEIRMQREDIFNAMHRI